jgi:hypothetical protein
VVGVFAAATNVPIAFAATVLTVAPPEAWTVMDAELLLTMSHAMFVVTDVVGRLTVCTVLPVTTWTEVDVYTSVIAVALLSVVVYPSTVIAVDGIFIEMPRFVAVCQPLTPGPPIES